MSALVMRLKAKCLYPQGQLSQRLGRTFALLNGATAQDALCIAVPDGVQLEQPIHIIYMTSGTAGLLLLAGLWF